MSKLIRQLLGESDPRFTLALSRLESAAGSPGVDVRLGAEIMSTMHAKMMALGLDPKDTTGAELYGALMAKLSETEEHVIAYLGHPANIDQAAQVIKKLVDSVMPQAHTWAVKDVSMRKLLKANPPKKVMKAFHFQSADSLARRMDPGQVILAARIVESKTWWAKTKKLYEQFGNQDFERTPVKVIMLTDARWMELLASEHTNGQLATSKVLKSKECGYVGVCPAGHYKYTQSLVDTLHAINELRLYGSLLKLHYVNPSIGNVLVHAIDDGDMMTTHIAGNAFHWRDVQRHFGLLVAEGERQFAHLDIHDLGWTAVETRLAVLIPDFSFWVGTDLLGVSYGDQRVVSCNISDLASSNTYADMPKSGLGRALKSELMARYLTKPIARALVLKQFDISGIQEENW